MRSSGRGLSRSVLGSTTVRPRDRVVACFDRSRSSGRTTIVAIHSPETGGLVLVQTGVRRLAHLARDKLPDVLAEQALHVLLLVSTLQGELAFRGRGSLGTELHQHEGDDVLHRPLHEIANFCEVHPTDLLRANAHHLRGLHHILLRGPESWVLVLNNLVESAEQLIVGVDLALLPLRGHHLCLTIASLLVLLILLILILLLLLAEVELQLLLAVVGHGCRMRGLRWAGGGDSKPSILSQLCRASTS
mmetsp:Transcript_16450/g.57506  ORF Transcript_16450/g.57506 Transcript_16450/m.57506 type:complete len:247 (-) Transcript_16450:2-742(-)